MILFIFASWTHELVHIFLGYILKSSSCPTAQKKVAHMDALKPLNV